MGGNVSRRSWLGRKNNACRMSVLIRSTKSMWCIPCALFRIHRNSHTQQTSSFKHLATAKRSWSYRSVSYMEHLESRLPGLQAQLVCARFRILTLNKTQSHTNANSLLGRDAGGRGRRRTVKGKKTPSHNVKSQDF